MAEQIPFSIAENLLTKLTSIASEEINLLYGFKNDLRKLQTTLSTIKAILVDADKKQEESLPVKEWIRRLKEVVYDADDLLDDVATEGLRRKVEGQGRVVRKECDFFSSSNQIAFRFKMSHRIKDVRERLDEVAKEMSDFGFIIRKEVGVDMRIKNSWRETDSFVLKSEIIGRDNDKEEIIKSLMCPVNQSNISVAAIVGFGGLGKTALAQLVFNDVKVVNYFDLKLWVCVSEESNVEMLVKLILKSATSKEVPNLSLEQLQIELRQCLEGKKYLLVLDDVWNINNRIWSQLRKYLMVGAIGSRILVTTRSTRVALAMGVDCPYALAGLTEDQSWDLFEMLAFREGTSRVNSNLIEIGKEIAKKCKGVPLAIRAIGGIMQLRSSESEWLSILENELWKVFESDSDIGPVLKLSYDDLPYHLKQCFAYCAMFPKDYKFDKEDLIQLWMAQGYVQSRSQSKDENLEEIGEGYFNELLFRSFFQKEEYCYKMHDLINDLAQSMAGDSCFVLDDNTNTKDIPNRIQHLFSGNLSFEECFKQLQNRGLRTLYCAYYGLKLSLCLDSIFSNWLSSITNLVDITLYKCPKCEHLPPLDNLPHLESLDLSQFDSLEYISDEDNLFSALSASTTTTFFPSLKFLNISVCRNLKGWWRTCMEAKMVPQFPCLSHVIISNCPNLTLMPIFPSLDTRLALSYVSIRPLQRTLQMAAMASAASSSVTAPFSKLKNLWLQGIENIASLPGEWMQNLSFLEELYVGYTMEISDEDERGIFKWRCLVSLRDLTLSNLSNLVSLPRELQYVTTLQHLCIWHCSNLRALPDWIGNLTTLENLSIDDCPELESLSRGIRQITTLQRLSIRGCPRLSERCGHDTAADWPNISHIPNVRIDERDIQNEGRYLL